MAVARPELLDRRPGWGGGRRNHTQLSLEPLEDRHIASLVTHLLGSEPSEAIRTLLVGRAEGNPFFAGELVRTLRDRGTLDLVDEEAVTRALAALPETVHATVLARLDLLSQEERATLQAGAVSGRSFDPDILKTLLPGVSNVHAVLDRLVDKDLVVPATGDRYHFRHLLIREVAYQTLPRTRRADDHVQLARYLETTAGDRADRIAGLIAFHYLEATRLRRGLRHVPPSANEEVRAKALAWLSRAARIDAAAGASVEAATGLREAISIATPEEEIPLQEQLSEVFFHGTEALERALALWRELRGADVVGARLLARYLIAAQRWWTVPMERRPSRETVERLNQEALDLAQRASDERVMGMVFVARAFSTYARPPESIELLERSRDEALEAATIFERLDDPYWLSASLDAVAFSHMQRGDFEKAFRVAGDRLRLIDRIPDVVERVDALCMAALLAMALGRLGEASDALQRALAIRVAGRALHMRLHTLAFAANLSTMRGDWDDAVRTAREGLDNWAAGACAIVTRGMAAGLYAARRRGTEATLAELASLIEDSPLALDEDPRIPITRGLTRAVAHNDPAPAEAVLGALERAGTAMPAAERALALLAAHSRAPGSVERLTELLDYAEQRRLLPIAAQLLRIRSTARGGNVEDLTRAETMLRDMGMKPDAALVTSELAALTGDRRALDAAKRDLAHIGDQVGLRRLAEVEAALLENRQAGRGG
jgi:tetratricopeptide (TPR) repeat protein